MILAKMEKRGHPSLAGPRRMDQLWRPSMNDDIGDPGLRVPPFLVGGGDLGSLIAAYDWSKTPLGLIETWPSSLITTVGLVVHSAVPIVMLWGEDGIMIYNDAYSVFAGGRHPELLGMKVREGWAEVADFNDNVMKVGLAGGTLAYRDQELTLYRKGEPEQVWMNLDYSPVLDESGRPAGVIAIVIETTERVLAERARAAAEMKVGQVLKSMAEGFVLLDRDFRVVTINDEALRYETRPRDRIVGLTHWEAWPGSEEGRIGTLFRQAVAEQVPVTLEHRYVWPGGRAAWLEARAYPSQEGLAVFYRDVTERKREEDRQAALSHVLELAIQDTSLGEALEELLRTIEALSMDGMAGSILLREGGHLRHGAAPSLPQAYNEAIDGIEIGPDIGSCGAAAHGGTPVYASDIATDPRWADFRELALSHDLRACWSTPILSRHGKVLGTFAMYYREPRNPGPADLELVGFVTRAASLVIEHKRAEAALRALNLDLEEQVEERTRDRDRTWRLSQDLLVIVEAKGSLMAVNTAWTKLLGWEAQELVGSRFLEFVHPDDVEATIAAFAGIFEAPLTTPYEYRFRHKDGTYRWFAWTGAFEDGRVYANGRHVTAEKEQAEALRQAEEALRQSQKMEAVGQLTGGIAHDFNNLLTGISGSLELLQARVSQGRAADAERYIGAAQGAARRAASLIHRLLAFSRRQTLDPKSTNINRLVAGMEELIRRTVGTGIEIEVVAAGGLWNTLADPNQIENALLNLCINARDAMPEGGRLTVETANRWLDERAARDRDLPPGQYVSLCVSDTGTGMTPDIIARAFDPFFTTKPIGMGTGLGLSMVYGFARQSGGQLRIYSEVGQGTMVCLYLPRHRTKEDDDDLPVQMAVLPVAEQGETVLVVDDEPTVLMLVTEVLQELGYAAVEAVDGAGGLKVLQSGLRLDLLITDVGLPGGINGRQLADAGRILRPDLKVLFITGYAENAVVGNGHLEPGMHVLTKPFAIDALANRITTIIASK